MHELLWFQPDQPGWHEHALVTHSRALENTNADGTVTDAATWADWTTGLELMARALTAEATWDWVWRRAAQIDDPRLTVAVLRALRRRLPEHVIGVSAALAVRASAVDRDQAQRHMALVRSAGFETRQVREAARAATEPIVALIQDACESVEHSSPESGLPDSRGLLFGTSDALATLSMLLSSEDDLVGACRDQVAQTINNRVIAYFNDAVAASSRSDEIHVTDAVELLRRARHLAHSSSLNALLDSNIADLLQFQYHRRTAGRSGAVVVPSVADPSASAALGGCLAYLVLFVAGAAAAFWVLSGRLDLGLGWSIGGSLLGGLIVLGVLGEIVDFFVDRSRR
ncbi:hypothetical protein [Promicromonospora sp. NPDC057488]|uniref:hypothetical protein n=1 Tax=Promicromonospora sp. NPDC057488 TaxID=3346147 RepID=UPI00366E7F66